MRIAYLTNEFVSETGSFDGGLSNYLHKVCKTLIDFGHQPLVFVLSSVDEEFEMEGIKVYRVSSKQNHIYKIVDKLTRFKYLNSINIVNNSYYLNKKVKEVNKRQQIDIVQYPSYLALGLFIPKGIPSVLRISSYQKLIDIANGNRQDAFVDKLPHLLEDITFKRAKHIIGPSRFLADFINNKFNKNVKVIESPNVPYTGIENNSIFNDLQEEIEGEKYLLFFGRLAKLKGVVDIADMLQELLLKNENIQMVFVGKDIGYNNKPTIDYIKEKTKETRNRVKFYSEQEHSKLYPLIRGSHLVLMPSRIENFPNACVEAMSQGKIVIATKGVSFEQLINDGENGFLCENSNPDSLLEIIENVLHLSLQEKAKIESKAKKTVERLQPEKTVKQLLSYYKSISK